MKIQEVMTKYPITCTPDTTIGAAARFMADADCGALPVIGERDEMPIGMITDRDIVVRAIALGRGSQTPVRECMTSPAVTLTEDTDLDECIKLLEERQIRRVLVVNNSGHCVGIVAQADVAEYASKRKAGALLQQVSKPASGTASATRHH